MKRLFDLRFVIGIFFLVIGLLLLLYGLFASATEGQSLNKWCGGIFMLFALIMLALSMRKPAE
jgi:uncharacterized membrane protein